MIVALSFLLLPDFMKPDEINGLVKRSKELLQEFTLEGHPMVRALILLFSSLSALELMLDM